MKTIRSVVFSFIDGSLRQAKFVERKTARWRMNGKNYFPITDSTRCTLPNFESIDFANSPKTENTIITAVI